MAKSCLSCSDDYSVLASGHAVHNSYSQDALAGYPMIEDWSILSSLVGISSKDCIEVVDSGSITTVHSKIEDDNIVYISSRKDFELNNMQFTGMMQLKPQNNEGQN